MSYIENLDEIKEKLDPEDVLDFIQPKKLKKRFGKELRTCCPVHGGEGPENFSIDLNSHNWICHSNGCKGTNLVDLYAKSKSIAFPEATKALADRFGIEVMYRDSSKGIQSHLRPTAEKRLTNESKPKTSSKPKYTPEDVLKCWEDASEQGRDYYFSKKQLKPPSIVRFGKNPYGYESTFIPMRDIDGHLQHLISIGSDGIKYNYNIRNDKGAFSLLGEVDPEGEFYIGEGIATVQTAWEATERLIPAVSCGSCKNMLHVLESIQSKYPNAKPIVLIDCDEGGCGLKAAAEIKKKFPNAGFRMPNFDGIPNPQNEKLSDFNDIISKCGQSLSEVKKQLKFEYKMTKTKERTETNLHEKSEQITKDLKLSILKNTRDYDVFEREHKNLFAKGGLSTGYKELDSKVSFLPGDFCVIQSMSNHGKTTFMTQLAKRFLREEKNKQKKPICIFVTYESSPIAVETKFLNLLGNECGEGTIITYKERYIYPDKKDYFSTISTFNEMQINSDITFLRGVSIEKIEDVIDLYKKEFPDRSIVLFLDYIQIIEGYENIEGWERIKKIAYKLEDLAISKEVLIITGCQVNDDRQTREGRDIYNAATTVIDILNHSHTSLLNNKKTEKLYKPPIGNKSVCTFAATKQKHGESFTLTDYFLFNGFHFEENQYQPEKKQTRDSYSLMPATK